MYIFTHAYYLKGLSSNAKRIEGNRTRERANEILQSLQVINIPLDPPHHSKIIFWFYP
jgi:hypothetical protein